MMTLNRQHLRVTNLIFISGAALMALEIARSRVPAPQFAVAQCLVEAA